MTVRLINPTVARDIKPGDKIEVFNDWYWVRYINYQSLNTYPSLTTGRGTAITILRKRPRCGDSTRRFND